MHTRLAVLFSLTAAIAGAQSSFPAAFAQVTATPLPAAPLGQGAWRFEVVPGWAKLPAGKTLGATHGGAAVDKAGNIYMSSDGQGIFVFAKDGKLLRTMAPEVTNLHGLVLREEAGKEYLYGALNNAAKVVKLTLDGKTVWEIGVPRESGIYAQPEDAKKKGAVNYKPTGVDVGPDGRIYVVDGYGASVLHIFDKNQKYLKTIGTRGEGENQFKTCHGIGVDTRFSPARLLVADRENKRLVHLDLDGKWLGVVTTDLRRPCALSFHGDYVAVAELQGRVVVIDKAGKIVSTLGDNPDQKQWAAFKLEPQHWQDGIFIAPHGLTFDKDGNLFVQDWNFAGRFTKLKRIGGKKS